MSDLAPVQDVERAEPVRRYRKRPVEVEAAELTWQTWSDVCALIGDPFPPGVRGVYVDPNSVLWSHSMEWENPRIGLIIPTLEGDMLAVEGDWVIRGTRGELYPCKPDVFADVYEPVDE